MPGRDHFARNSSKETGGVNSLTVQHFSNKNTTFLYIVASYIMAPFPEEAISCSHPIDPNQMLYCLVICIFPLTTNFPHSISVH